MKVPQDIIDLVKKTLIAGFFTKSSLKEVAEHVTDALDDTKGGFWLCAIKPQDIEEGLTKSDFRALSLTFNKGDIVYDVKVS